MKKEIKACCFTGYRPGKMPILADESAPQYKRFENKLIDAIFSLPDEGCFTFYSGAAMGFDIIAAECVLLLKRARPEDGIRLICAIPFPGQASKYPPEWLERYKAVLAAADEVVTVCDRYSRDCYQRRNEYMADHSDIVITWFDGQPGGTRNTLRYAQGKGLRIVNLQGEGVHEYLHEEDYQIVFEQDCGVQLGVDYFSEIE